MTEDRMQQYITAHMNVAKEYAKLSHAVRLKVGAALVSPDNTRVLVTSFNGTPSGWYTNVCEYTNEDGSLTTKPEVVHAELNAIAFAAKYGIPTKDCIMYVTHSCCTECAKNMIQAGIKTVYYIHEYRRRQ